MLIMIVPYQSSPHRQRMQVYLWWIVITIVYSVLVSLFRVKNRGKILLYPAFPLRLILGEQDIRSNYFSKIIRWHPHLHYAQTYIYI